MSSLPPRAWGPLTFGVWVCLSLLLRGGVPFVHFPAFQFPAAGGTTAVPLLLADGADADIRDFTGFAGLDPSDVDTGHHGVPCSVEHRLYEARAWLAGHLAPDDAPGPVRIQLGLRILSVDEDGALHQVDRIDGTGTATRRAP